jgi:hypothetical protein
MAAPTGRTPMDVGITTAKIDEIGYFCPRSPRQ